MQESLKQAVDHWNMVAPIIEVPKNAQDYNTLLVNLKDAIALVGNQTDSPLSGLIKAITNAALEYERDFMVEQQGSALLALRYLMRLHNIKQSELKEVGSQGVVSEILNNKRSLTLRHVKELAKKFNVSPNVFID